MNQSWGGNQVHGTATGPVVQAGTIAGGVHLHAAGGVAPPVPRQVPAPANHFVGREAELAVLDGLLDGLLEDDPGTTKLCVVNGMPGIGKSALAGYWALRRADRFPDGQLYVDLRGMDPTAAPVQPGDALRGFLDAFGLPPDSWPSELPRQSGLFRSLTAGRRLLVVLDNASDSRQVEPLLPGGSGCRVVVTSRTCLTGLVTRAGARRIALGVLSRAEAHDMLTRMLGAERAAGEPEAVGQLIDYADRWPLAVAILGGRLVGESLPLSALATQVSEQRSSLDALDSGEPGLAARTVFSWSYRALTRAAAAVFRFASLHPGPDVTARSAAALSGESTAEAARALAELARAHLVEHYVPGRYRVHDLLRRYGRELTTAPAQEAAFRRLADHYLRSACAANEHLGSPWDPIRLEPPSAAELAERFPGRGAALAWLEAERSGLLATLSLKPGTGQDAYTWRLAVTLVTFLDRQGHRHDLLQSQQAALLAAQRIGDDAGTALAHRLVGRALLRLGRLGDAGDHLRKALAYFDGAGDLVGQTHTCYALSYIAVVQRRRDEALVLARRTLTLARRCGRGIWCAKAIGNLGWWHLEFGEPERALDLTRRALDRFRALGTEPDGEAHTLECLGRVYAELGLSGFALNTFAEALHHRRHHGSYYWQVRTHCLIADAQHALGDAAAERQALEEALRILVELDDPQAESVENRLAALARSGADGPPFADG